ncbi:hypothetical protein CCR91_21650 [Thiorhodovibrio winogradskyi]|nr:hypothetical protein [Thiorhodovibrio winogradskyi]
MLGSRRAERNAVEPGLWIQIVFARFVNEPYHVMTSVFFDDFIEPTELEVVAGDVAGISLCKQTTNSKAIV